MTKGKIDDVNIEEIWEEYQQLKNCKKITENRVDVIRTQIAMIIHYLNDVDDDLKKLQEKLI